MWTRGKDKEQPGKFAFELFEGFTLIKCVGGFNTAQEADRAAEIAQREALFPQSGDSLPEMTLDEILAELDL